MDGLETISDSELSDFFAAFQKSLDQLQKVINSNELAILNNTSIAPDRSSLSDRVIDCETVEINLERKILRLPEMLNTLRGRSLPGANASRDGQDIQGRVMQIECLLNDLREPLADLAEDFRLALRLQYQEAERRAQRQWEPSPEIEEGKYNRRW